MTLDARPDRDLGAEAIAGVGALGAGAVLLGGALVGRIGLLVAVLVVQVLLVAAWWLVTRASWPWTTVVIAAAAAVAADLTGLSRSGDPVGRVVGVLGLCMVAAVTLELLRPGRTEVTVSLAAALSGAAVVVATSTWLSQVTSATSTTSELARGLLEVAVVATGVAVGGRLLGTALLPAAGPWREAAAAVLGVAVGIGLGVLMGTGATGSPATTDVLATAGATAVMGALVAGLVRPHRGGWGSVVLAAALPLVVTAPVCLVLSRVLLS